MSTQFRVTLKNFKGRNLPAKDTNGKSDPFLDCNFDNFKTFRTEIIKANLNPDWKFEITFFYETRYADKLDKKVLKIDCYDYDRFGKNDYIGTFSLDLLTACTGPINHDILLRDGGKPAGRLQFDLEMEQISDITVTLKEIHVSGYTPFDPEGNGDVTLNYYYTGSKDKKMLKSGTVKPSQLNWPDVDQLYFTASLKELLNESIILKIIHNQRLKSDTIIGDAQLRIKGLLANTTFKENVTKEGKNVGEIEGNIHFTNVPRFAQMVTGKHTDTGIVAGQPLLPYLPVPKGFSVDVTPNSPTVTPNSPAVTNNSQTPSPVVTPVNQQSTSVSMYPDLGKVSLSPITPPLTVTPKPPVLPPGWEMRLDVSSGRNYYVDHNTQTSHWTLPAHITTPPSVVATSNLPYPTTSSNTSSSNLTLNVTDNASTNVVPQSVTQAPEQTYEMPSPSVPSLNASTEVSSSSVPDTTTYDSSATAPFDANSTAPHDPNSSFVPPQDSTSANTSANTAPYDASSTAPYGSSAPYGSNAPYQSSTTTVPQDSNTAPQTTPYGTNSAPYNTSSYPGSTTSNYGANTPYPATTGANTTTPYPNTASPYPGASTAYPGSTATPYSYGNPTSPTTTPYGNYNYGNQSYTSPTASRPTGYPGQYPPASNTATGTYPYSTTGTTYPPTSTPNYYGNNPYVAPTPTSNTGYPYPGNYPPTGATPYGGQYPQQQQQQYPYGQQQQYPYSGQYGRGGHHH